MSKSKILVTGCAGFIGSNLVDSLLDRGFEVIGVDNFNNFYDPKIKEVNISNANRSKKFKLYREDILDLAKILEIFKKEKPQKIVHLAARAGVRPSIIDPFLYAQVNCLGTINMLKASADNKAEQFIFGSSSSVYGNSPDVPFRENDLCRNIVSPYASSKRSAEFLVETFSKNYGLKSTILRLFTVYGERGRPDMAPALFTRSIIDGAEINQFGNGLTSRDYTYIGDIVEGIVRSLETLFDFEIINLGNNSPVILKDFIKLLEKAIGRTAKIKKMRARQGDVEKTWANIEKAKKLLSWEPKTGLAVGLFNYVNWVKNNQ